MLLMLHGVKHIVMQSWWILKIGKICEFFYILFEMRDEDSQAKPTGM